MTKRDEDRRLAAVLRQLAAALEMAIAAVRQLDDVATAAREDPT